MLEKYSSCIKCTGEVVADIEDLELGTCAKCGTMQCMDAAKEDVIAQVMVRLSNGTCSLRAFGQVVKDIAQIPADQQISMKSLLKAEPFTMCYRDGIIQSVSRNVCTSLDNA